MRPRSSVGYSLNSVCDITSQQAEEVAASASRPKFVFFSGSGTVTLLNFRNVEKEFQAISPASNEPCMNDLRRVPSEADVFSMQPKKKTSGT